MATKPARARQQLGQLLQEQQEPFMLDAYLSERGYVVRKKNKLLTSSGSNFIGCGHANSSCKFLPKKSGNQNKISNKNKGTIPNFPKVLKAVCNKLFTVKKGLKPKNSGHGHGHDHDHDHDHEDGKPSSSTVTDEMDRNNQEAAEPDRFSTASSTTVYNSCSDSDLDEQSSLFSDNNLSSLKLYDQREKQAVADTQFQWSCMEESKQHSPVSVLDDLMSTSEGSLDNTANGVSSTKQTSFLLPKLMTEDSILSASLLNLLLQTTPDKSSSCSDSSRFALTKRVLQQTKQLLFDCVRELVDSHSHSHDSSKEGKGRECLGSEEIGQVICEKVKAWGKGNGDESNISELLKSELMDHSSRQEWSEFEIETQRRDIGVVIGNAILEEMTTEVVVDLIILNLL